ncbi:hypothetical protein SLEP1_g41676 [Rubroshorea leprosula]|uniref:Uncharacterized protein n=1 Tax=Rubroshorea leprosula TaxID=152421 RepID=A0AAV5L7A7_9ROSI|nr:hypothetical protein SLEP1_g41676 [Rubroshorea leprosula]
MEHSKKKLIILLSIASVAALSIIFRRRRQKKNRRAARCYLHTDPKPQYTFKRVLADNSYSPFNHLNLDGLEEKSQPYEADIMALVDNPPVEFKFLEGVDVDLEMSDSYVWVDTELQLTQLADALSKEKVFHGADDDVVWLQRDFHL